MALDLQDCSFFGPALPEPFVKLQLEAELAKRKLLPKTSGDEGRALQDRWEVFRRKLRALGEQGGDRRVAGHVLEPLVERLGYERCEPQGQVITREGAEDGGWLFTAPHGRVLRAWSVGLGIDLDAPSRRGRAYRFSPSRVAQRVLLASGERVGLLTDGEELRLLLCDPARPDSHIAIRLDRSGGWRAARSVPDSFRLLLALASPEGVVTLPELTEAARLAQSTVTKKLRLQARQAIEGFLQELLDHPENQTIRAEWPEPAILAHALWREGLILVYRLLFVFKLESAADPARAFSFAATSLWRNTYSPNTALAGLVRRVLDQGADTGGFLESGLRTLWRLFATGMSSSELVVRPLGGMLFGQGTTPLLDRLRWGERGVARLLDALLWTPGDGRTERERVHYGALDVEDLGRVYEALLELEPGVTTEPMCRLRRAKLEVVVPLAQGTPYRANQPLTAPGDDPEADLDGMDEADEEGDEDEAPKRDGRSAAGGKTQVLFIEEIPAGRFFLRVGLGRKATGSFYTPHPFVRFLVQETLGPLLAACSPKEDPHPALILALKVLDPAMGSGHFLVEACRYLGEALYEACRLCDELAAQAEEQAAKAKGPERHSLLARAAELRQRVADLPDPEDELVAYLPSRAAEGEESGLSQRKAEALCRRLVAVHCLYGVDKNPLAVELAKLSLWLESYAEGLPLTFLDHRLICGDSLTGPFVEHLLTYPQSGAKLDDLFAQDLTERLKGTLAAALGHVRDLETSVGKDVADLELKRSAKEKLDAALAPLKTLAAAWSGGVMLGDQCDDAGYQALAQAVADGAEPDGVLAARPRLREMVMVGGEAVAFELAFPEAFRGDDNGRGGFDAVVGNPPWDAIQFKSKEFLAAFNLEILNAPTKRERTVVEQRLLANTAVASLFEEHQEGFERTKRANDRLFQYQKVIIDGDLAGRQLDAFRVFMERNAQLLRRDGFTGVVVPSAFHANAGATGVRQLYLEKMALKFCFSFENRKKLFDIDSRQKFAAVVAQNSKAGTVQFECGFYWHDLECLFESRNRLRYTLSAVKGMGGEYLLLFELRNPEAATIARRLSEGKKSVKSLFAKSRIRLQKQPLAFDMSKDADKFFELKTYFGAQETRKDYRRFTLIEKHNSLFLTEGKTFFQYDDLWGDCPKHYVPLSSLSSLQTENACHFRLAMRAVASSTNERTAIFCVIGPATVVGHSVALERQPQLCASAVRLSILALGNSYCFDWLARQMMGANLTLFVLGLMPTPSLIPFMPFLCHSSLRLSCNHDEYVPLWTEQLGDNWREPTPRHTWPVLAGDDARWAVRAAIDAVVADAYGLDRSQYAHILSTFSHKSYPKAPDLCLASFDELKSIGLDAFIKRHDPYWDIPLNEDLPKPVIDLPLPTGQEHAEAGLGPLFDGLPPIPTSRTATPRSPSHPAPRPRATAGEGAYMLILHLLNERGLIGSAEAQQVTGLDATGVRPHLARLVAEGRATTEGQRRGMKYRRVDG